MISPRSSPRFVRRSITPTTCIAAAPPPLPPRKSSPTLEQTVNVANSANSNSHPNLTIVRNGYLNEAQSVLNLSLNEVSPPPSVAKCNSMHEIFVDAAANDSNGHVIELSAPKTIFGIIDSRFNLCNIDSSTTIPNTKTPTTRHQSVPTSGNITALNCPVKSHTTPNISGNNLEIVPPYENIRIELPPKCRPNPLTAKDNGSVSYENLNMDYIKKLVSEGYSKDAVIRALGITRNNVDMACDILHEFGTKHG